MGQAYPNGPNPRRDCARAADLVMEPALPVLRIAVPITTGATELVAVGTARSVF